MSDDALNAATRELLGHLGLEEEPLGVFYTGEKPEDAFAPRPGPPVSRELEEAGKIDLRAVAANFTCLMGSLWLARKKRRAAFISAEQYGCMGGSVYSGMVSPHLKRIEAFVSTGVPGTPTRGERYISSPEAMRRYFADLDMRRAPAAYCVFKPLSMFGEGEKPELVIFFARPEALSGLFTLVTFVVGEADSVVSPFASGCGSIISWPLHYLELGREVAVLGGFDPSVRKFMKTDELTLTVPFGLYRKMLAALPDSHFNIGGAWADVRKKIARSAAAWGETGKEPGAP